MSSKFDPKFVCKQTLKLSFSFWPQGRQLLFSVHPSSRRVCADATHGNGLAVPPEVDFPGRSTRLADDCHAVVQRYAGVECGRSVSPPCPPAMAADAPSEHQEARKAVHLVVLLQGPGTQRLALQARAVSGAERRADGGQVVLPTAADELLQVLWVDVLHRLHHVQHLDQALLLRGGLTHPVGPDPD